VSAASLALVQFVADLVWVGSGSGNSTVIGLTIDRQRFAVAVGLPGAMAH
jgi:hypothetical protein